MEISRNSINSLGHVKLCMCVNEIKKTKLQWTFHGYMHSQHHWVKNFGNLWLFIIASDIDLKEKIQIFKEWYSCVSMWNQRSTHVLYSHMILTWKSLSFSLSQTQLMLCYIPLVSIFFCNIYALRKDSCECCTKFWAMFLSPREFWVINSDVEGCQAFLYICFLYLSIVFIT